MRASVLKKGLPLAVVATVVLSGAIGAAPASANSPWWQVMTGARPTNLWKAPDETEVQEVKGSSFFGVVFAAKIEVRGAVIGCLGSGSLAGFGGPSANELCKIATGFPASETAEEFETMLEGTYGAGKVKVTGGPAGSQPFEVTSAWGPPIHVVVIDFELFGETYPAGENVGSEILSKGSGRLVLTLTNLGDAPVDGSGTPLTITDKLPAGVTAYDVEGNVAWTSRGSGVRPLSCAIEAGGKVVCSFTGAIEPYEGAEVEIYVAVDPVAAGAPGEVTVAGGGAPNVSISQPITVSEEKTPFGLQTFSAQPEAEGGGPVTHAGSLPFQFTNTIQFNQAPMHGKRTIYNKDPVQEAPALPRNLRFPLPAGLVGNATAVAQCSMRDFFSVENSENRCGDATAIGAAVVTIDDYTAYGLGQVSVPVFNLPPAQGEPARFGFLAIATPVVIDTSLDPGSGYRITASVNNTSQLAHVLASTVTLWGNPSDPRHDISRGWNCVYTGRSGPCTRPEGLSETPFLRMPVSCSGPLGFPAEIEPWNVPLGEVIVKKSFTSAALDGCSQAPFDPTIAAAPTSKLAENPSGLSFELTMPHSWPEKANDNTIAEGQPKKVEVTLPEGVTINPSEGEGLVACTEADYARETATSAPGEGCPEASKIGNVQISTPLLEEEAQGALYLAKPYENFAGNSLIALYLVAKIPDRGVLVKLPGKVEPDAVTGQLVTTFDNLPQLPFSSFKLHFREGARAPLVTPPMCGTYQTVARFVPWSVQDPNNPAPGEVVERTASFTIEHGVDGGACPAGGTPPFKPSLVAGTLNNAAGGFSPFYMRIERKDGEQEITGFSTKLPPGLVGSLSGIPFCGEAQIAAARAQSGAEAQTSSACPAASQIGHTVAEAGVGTMLARTPGGLYLGGPFEGAPFSLVSVTSAQVGPFDLGTVVVHLPLRIDPLTAQVTVPPGPADQIPHIMKGVVIHLRTIRIYIDRSRFIFNPTSCAPMSVTAGVVGSGASFTTAADDQLATASNRFQAADCQALAFKPKFTASTSGKTSRQNGASLNVKLTYPKGAFGKDANIRSVKVRLPKQLPSRLTTLQKACPAATFAANPATCPAGSKVGGAKVITPVLPVPLEGPAYFVSYGGEEFPKLTMVLQGDGVTVELVGDTFIQNGVTTSTFRATPDVPFESFELHLPKGSNSALAANGDLCRQKLVMPTAFTAQNGLQLKQSTKIAVSGCPKAKKKAKKKK